ncbi:hypothetical protein FACS189493_7760 [Spirochaetia bacterium]|nr:hypothetical protein FACS189493_7760 [Spirochaetia bacterium]
MTQSEIENFYVYSGLVFGTPMYAIGNWDKAFADKQSAQTWFDDIVERAITVNALIEARDELYQQNVRVFKRIPSITTRDTVLRDKNNLIEAYNRYKPINADIEEVFVKGVTLEKGKAFGRSYQYPGLRSDAVTRKINAYENEYATLIDTYPVN